MNTPWFQWIFAFGLPFFGYFVGIVIRRTALDKPGGPPLHHQLLVGIPLSLVTVPPLMAVLPNQTQYSLDAAAFSRYLVNLGMVMGAGMALPEAAARFLRKCIGGSPAPVEVTPMKRSRTRADAAKRSALT
jgi:hypothetical protein